MKYFDRVEFKGEFHGFLVGAAYPYTTGTFRQLVNHKKIITEYLDL